MNSKQALRLSALLLICLAFSLIPHTAQAQGLATRTFEVNTFEDLYDNVQDRSCASLSGKCSLRAAVTEAGIIYDDTPAFVHIKLPPGVYTLSLTAPPFAGSSEVHYGDLDLPELPYGKTPNDVLIEGTGGPGKPSVIDTNFIDRVLELGKYRKLTLRNLIIKNGLVEADNNDAALGGGIAARSDSTLILENVRLTNNTVRCISESACTWTEGGAIYSENADLSLLNVELDHNSAYFGSAIYFWDGTPHPDVYWHTFSIKNAAIHHNNAYQHTIDSVGRLFLTNTTMTDNQSTYSNSFEIYSTGETWVQNSTIILAVKKFGLGFNGEFYLRNSLLLHSPVPQPRPQYCWINETAQIISEGGNIFSDNSCNHDLTKHDLVLQYDQLRLSTLQDNGGPTPTIGLLAGSPAINRLPGQCIAAALESGSITEAPLTVDQRGSLRNDGRCDSGAFEAIYLQYLPLIRK